MQAVELKRTFKARESAHERAGQVRIHRAISWLARAEQEGDDADAQFVFLWISFNAAYAQDLREPQDERTRLNEFLGEILAVDDQRSLHHALFQRYSGPVRTLIENRFVYAPFWRAERERDSSNKWQQQFETARAYALKSMLSGDTATVLAIVFDRLYVLRNQLVHGGATWNSSLNRAQLRDGVNLLLCLIPLILQRMIENPHIRLGEIHYPVV